MIACIDTESKAPRFIQSNVCFGSFFFNLFNMMGMMGERKQFIKDHIFFVGKRAKLYMFIFNKTNQTNATTTKNMCHYSGGVV